MEYRQYRGFRQRKEFSPCTGQISPVFVQLTRKFMAADFVVVARPLKQLLLMVQSVTERGDRNFKFSKRRRHRLSDSVADIADIPFRDLRHPADVFRPEGLESVADLAQQGPRPAPKLPSPNAGPRGCALREGGTIPSRMRQACHGNAR